MIVQLVPAFNTAPQVFVWLNSAEFIPLLMIPLMSRSQFALLVSVAARILLALPSTWFPKSGFAGDSATALAWNKMEML